MDSVYSQFGLLPRSTDECRWDLVALGEVMLRLDPGEDRIQRARHFRVWEGGGEYNVARGLKRCFGLRTAIATSFADNPVGRLIEDLIYQGGVDQSLVKWVGYDGVGWQARNGLNFTERGFGVRAAVGCSDRGHSAASQLAPGDFSWDQVFRKDGARWFHTGGIFCALSKTTAELAHEAMQAARSHGVITSFDLNYRPSLWKSNGGQARAQEVNRTLAHSVDVMLGNEEDFSAALGFEVKGMDLDTSKFDPAQFKCMIERVASAFPNLKVIAVTLRNARSATRNDWGAICYCGGNFFEATPRQDLEILDRVGGGDSFASGLIYGILAGHPPQWAVECGAAHGALAMTTPGDTSCATLSEVQQLMKGVAARIAR